MADAKNFEVSQPGDLIADIRASKRDEDIRIVFGLDT